MRRLVAFIITVFFPSIGLPLEISPAPDVNKYVQADTVKVKHYVTKALPSTKYYKVEVIDESNGSVFYSATGSPSFNVWTNHYHVQYFPSFSEWWTDDLQAQAVPLKPGKLNTINIKERVGFNWYVVASYTGLRTNPSYKVLPIRIHLLTLDATEPAEDWDPTINDLSNRYWQYPYVFTRWFDTYDWPHCSSSGTCSANSTMLFYYPEWCSGDSDCDPGFSCLNSQFCIRKTCTTDSDCPSGWACDNFPAQDHDGTFSRRRLCWPSSQAETWSVDMAFTPGSYLPSSVPSASPYVNCQTLFQVEDGNFSNSYSYSNLIDVITFEDAWKTQFNCGAFTLRAEAVRRAYVKGTLQSNDEMIHVFLTRSLATSPTACTLPGNCPATAVAGIHDTISYGVGLPNMPIAFLALESQCNPISSNTTMSMDLAHEIGHEGDLDHYDGGTAPTNGNLMEQYGAFSITTQNYHLFRRTSSPIFNLCDIWMSSMNSDFDSDPRNLNQ